MVISLKPANITVQVSLLSTQHRWRPNLRHIGRDYCRFIRRSNPVLPWSSRAKLRHYIIDSRLRECRMKLCGFLWWADVELKIFMQSLRSCGSWHLRLLKEAAHEFSRTTTI